MDCPKCKNTNKIKAGIVRCKQRYHCKLCKYYYTVSLRSRFKAESVKKKSLELYLEGLGFRAIGRILKVSHYAVYTWIKKYGKTAEEIKSKNEIEIVEIDEMHTYVSKKKLLLDLDSSRQAFKKNH